MKVSVNLRSFTVVHACLILLSVVAVVVVAVLVVFVVFVAFVLGVSPTH